MAPCLRKDLVATIVDEQGVSCVEVTDPISGVNFRFYDFEYALAQQLTGQPLDLVVSWALETYGVELSAEALDQFIEKLAGLGFLVGGSSGAQPATLVPSSASSGSHPFGELPTTVAMGLEPIPEAPPLISFDEFPSEPSFGDAVAPEGLISGDATEYRLKETTSGLWEQNRPDLVAADRHAPLASPEAEIVLPRLEILAEPLPPVFAVDDVETRGPEERIATATPPGAPPGNSLSTQTPLALITQAINAESSGPAPIGALDAGTSSAPIEGAPVSAAAPVPTPPFAAAPFASAISPPASSATTPSPAALSTTTPFAPTNSSSPLPATTPSPSASSMATPFAPAPSPPSPSAATPSPAALASAATARAAESVGATDEARAGGSWAIDLAQQVEQPRAERRQPPRPEVVVMPPVAEVSAPPSPPKRRFTALFVLLFLAGVAAAAAWFLRPRGIPHAPVVSPDAPTVHVVSPQPTTFYRWFDTVGTVVPGRDDTLSFSTAGRLQDAMPPRTTFRAGETIARLVGVAARELTVNRIRARVSFYEQLRDSSRAEGSEAAAREAEAKLTARRHELGAAQAALAELEIHPKVAGEIAELLIPKGAFVRAGAPVFRVRATGPRAIFPLSSEDVARARTTGFCRVETIAGSGGGPDAGPTETAARAIDCTPSSGVDHDQAQLAVDLVGPTVAAPGTQVRLASARYDGVFPVPRSALFRLDGTNRLWVVAGGGRTAESRVVEIAATVGELSLVARGLGVGDAVIVSPPPALTNGAAVNVTR